MSIHVPAYNEPPQMLIETLDALARLDYPDYEVIVVDNNTKDEAVWRPVERHCAQLGARSFSHALRNQRQHQRAAVAEHVARVGQERETAAQIADDGFDHHEGERECEREAQLRAIDQREAFLLKYVEELSYEEMSALTGASVSALKMRVKRACDRLRGRWDEIKDA